MRYITQIIFSVLAVVGLSLFNLPTAAFANEGTVLIATVDDTITAGTVPYLERALKQAQATEADLFFIELNTPGGLLKATEDISRLLVESSIPTAVFVYKDAGWALSAGVYILLSADTAISHPTASIGAATPILGDGGDSDTKTINATAKWLGQLAERNNIPADLVTPFIFEAVTKSGQDAFEEGIVKVLATTTDEALAALGFLNPEIIRVEPNLADKTLNFISLPYLIPLLLSLGALGIFFMFRTGEIETIGILGVVFLLLGLWGMGSITVSTLGVLLLIVGIGLLITELMIAPGFGVVGVAGVIALVISVMTFANEPLYAPYLLSTMFYGVVGVFLAIGLIMVWLGQLSVRAQLLPIKVGSEAWYGKQLMLASDLTPTGRITIEGDSYLARSVDETSIPAGTLVKIVKIEGNTILVILADKTNI